MDHLDKLVASTLKSELAPKRLASNLISRKLSALGVDLRDEQLRRLERDLDIDHLDTLVIDLDDEQARKLEPYRDEPSHKIVLHFDDIDVESLEGRLEKAIASFIPEVLSTSSDNLLAVWKSQADKVLKGQRKVRLEFEKRIQAIWGQAIQMLEMLLGVCLDIGSEFNQHFRPGAARQGDLVFESLTRLHARGCQVGAEILTLLKGGLADGAFARWRTLHEIAVTTMFISKHGHDVAERYLAHTAITDYHEAISYQRHCKTLGYEPLSNDELDSLTTQRDKLRQLYGNGFDSDYGWASNALGVYRPTFTMIEENVSLEHLRPFYKMANWNIHAGAKGIAHRLGLPIGESDLLVAGPSVYGLSEPGQNTAISINQLTTTLLLTKPNLDRLAYATATQKLVGEIFDEFTRAHEGLEEKAAD